MLTAETCSDIYNKNTRIKIQYYYNHIWFGYLRYDSRDTCLQCKVYLSIVFHYNSGTTDSVSGYFHNKLSANMH